MKAMVCSGREGRYPRAVVLNPARTACKLRCVFKEHGLSDRIVPPTHVFAMFPTLAFAKLVQTSALLAPC